MDTITVDKSQLIDRLTNNRAEHRAIFIEAQDNYRQQMIAELDRALKEARDGGRIIRAFTLPVPEDHTDDFDTAIQMLTWHQGDSIALTQREFTRYVENKWEWRASWARNTGSYSSMLDADEDA